VIRYVLARAKARQHDSPQSKWRKHSKEHPAQEADEAEAAEPPELTQ